MTLPTYHIWHDTPEGRLPFTLFVFGPYAGPEYDVEIYSGHINDEERLGANYVTTVSSLTRNTHVIADVWNTLNEALHV